jgi:hypothetical protein
MSTVNKAHTARSVKSRKPNRGQVNQKATNPLRTAQTGGQAAQEAESALKPSVIRVSETVLRYDVSGASGTRTWSEPRSEMQPMPSREYAERVIAAAQTRERRRALHRERGMPLPKDVGWDEQRGAWALMIRDDVGIPVNWRWRPPRGSAGHPFGIRGRVVENGCLPLYPNIPEGDTWLLVAGEWDALAARLHDLPAVTGLCGKLWMPQWDRCAFGKRIAVMYDRGEEHAARTTVAHLNDIGAAEAWFVGLPLLEHGADVEEWFRGRKWGGYGRSARELIEIIREARVR